MTMKQDTLEISKSQLLRSMTCILGVATVAMVGSSSIHAASGKIRFESKGTQVALHVDGDPDDEWRFQLSTDLGQWVDAPGMGTVLSGGENAASIDLDSTLASSRFVRVVQTDGLFDRTILRSVYLTFTNSNWATLLANARTSGGNVPCNLRLENGVTATNVGARYKGNSSYSMGGTKKSVNLDINYTNSEARVMGFRAINLNNAAGDNTIMREPLYFNVLRDYAPCPHGTMARLYINGAYWGVYSMVDQNNNELLDEYFPSHDGDRWRAPNIGGGAGGGGPGGGGGGGGFTSAASAFSYLGATASSYANNYELKSENSTNAWERLVHAIDVLNNTPTAKLRDSVEDAFAVDRWLWFLAVENIFVDDDSYWNKGADYAFYYEPESGRIHPVEHDGNEAFTAAMGINYTLSPVIGSTGTNRPLLLKFLGIPELRQRYLAHMRTVLAERFHPSILTTAIDQYRDLTSAAIIEDPKKSFNTAGYNSAVAAVKTYVTNRYNFLINHAELTPVPPRIVQVNGPATNPGPSDVPMITAKVESPDGAGLDSVWLYWRDKPYGRFSSVQMLDDGSHGDGVAGDGVYGGATAAFPAGNKIHYYVEARSANAAKAASFSPARAEQQTYDYRVTLTVAASTSVVINEFMAANSKTIADPQGEFEDWIELHNVTDAPVSLTGRYLTDESDNPRKWAFPSGTTIPAGGYLLVWADEDGAAPLGLHANFKLEKSGEKILLIDTDERLNAVLDSVTYEAQETDISYGRSAANADVFVRMSPTPAKANSGVIP